MIGRVIWNTMILVVVVSTAVVALSFVISLVVVRSKFIGRKILDQLAFSTHAIPGIVIGLAFLWIFLQANKIGIPDFGTVWFMCIAFTASYIAYGTRAMNAVLLQIHKQLAEAAVVSGARHWRTMKHIFLPLLMPAFVALARSSMQQNFRGYQDEKRGEWLFNIRRLSVKGLLFSLNLRRTKGVSICASQLNHHRHIFFHLSMPMTMMT